MSLSCRSARAAVFVVLSVAAVRLQAQERKYAIGAGVDLVSGGSSGERPVAGSLRPGSFFLEMYPSVQMSALTAHSSFALSYTFGFRQNFGDAGYDSKSHGAAVQWTGAAGPRWKFNLSDSFQQTSDSTTFNTTRGVSSTPEGFNFLFSPIAYNQSTRTNTASITSDYAPTDRSSLSFGGSYSLLIYPQQQLFNGALSDQQRISESVTYSYKTNERDTWSVGYSGARSDFKEFQTTTSHVINAGYSRQLTSDLVLQVTGGPAYVQTSGTGSYQSYDVQASVRKLIKTNTLSIHYAHESGEATGLGSISDNDRGGFSLNHRIGRNADVFVDLSAFNTRGRGDSLYSTRGISAAANFGVSITRRVSLRWGGQYQHYDQTSPFGFDQRRVYVSLRVSNPELRKFSQ